MLEYCSAEISELAKALIAVQRELLPAARDGTNPFTRSNYATLNSVMEACRDVLLAHGIWMTQLPVPAPVELGPGHIGLLTKLTHAESGQWQSSLAVVPLPKADPQGMGSAITYARRYALTAMLGIITEEDDDGEAAKMHPKTSGRVKQPRNGAQVQKGFQDRQTHADKNSGTSKRQYGPFADLPQLDGVSYQIVNAQDGRECIVATGDTQTRSEILAGAGFRWNAQRKFWWKYAGTA